MGYNLPQLIIDFGPALATATFTLLSFTITIFIFIAKKILKLHKAKTSKLSETLTELSADVTSLHSQVQVTNQKDDYFKESILRLEGVIKSQQDTLYTHIEKIAKVDSKLDAVFRFIDAPRRATDGDRQT